ncbi:hypothetical protein [uncultured Methanobrevibacter sp.]|uniref:hypothetical protein n=1 Tax=uncultured Methanobrevibacter sp. TaxID=253161 RepID=UPI0025D50095|nr:hypothetical protein [uncultured Methanobrevibacter sp.]
MEDNRDTNFREFVCLKHILKNHSDVLICSNSASWRNGHGSRISAIKDLSYLRNFYHYVRHMDYKPLSLRNKYERICKN